MKIAMVAALLLAGCTTGGSIGSIHEGMTRDEVIATLGAPDGAQRQGQTESLVYASRLMSGWSWDKADYVVVLVDGRVSAYGPTVVRAAPPPQPAVGAFTIFAPH